MKLLGERIRRKRESLHMQLNELAKKVGVSSSALSQIEKAKASPSIVTLKAIADSLHTTIGELIGENEVLTKNPLVRFDEKSFVEKNESGTSLYLLSNHGNNKQMETFLIDFEEDSDSQNLMKIHPGQEFCFVLKGEIEIQLEDKKFILQEKDSFYFNSNRMHFARNRAKGISQILWVVTPPDE
jgi:transcriptional regulator with XRE-family HTH domain